MPAAINRLIVLGEWLPSARPPEKPCLVAAGGEHRLRTSRKSWAGQGLA